MAITATQSSNHIRNVAVGRYKDTSTAAAFTITTGFKPRYVKILNIDGLCMEEWTEGMADASALKTVELGLRHDRHPQDHVERHHRQFVWLHCRPRHGHQRDERAVELDRDGLVPSVRRGTLLRASSHRARGSHMKFSDTSNKNGLIQDCEHWTNLGDGIITGDTTLFKRFTALLNVHYAEVLGKLQLLSGTDGAEDRNYPDQQFSTFAITSGVSTYEFLTDEDGNTITDFRGVHIQTPSGTDFVPLDRLNLSDSDAQLVMSPNASNAGTPTGFIEKGSVLYFDKIPDFTGTGKLFYRLVPSYFTVADTTKTPGFAELGHRLLSLGASLDWLLVNKPEATVLITRLEEAIAKINEDLEDYTRQKNSTRARMIGAVHSSR